jgi:hypothetical protein
LGRIGNGRGAGSQAADIADRDTRDRQVGRVAQELGIRRRRFDLDKGRAVRCLDDDTPRAEARQERQLSRAPEAIDPRDDQEGCQAVVGRVINPPDCEWLVAEVYLG